MTMQPHEGLVLCDRYTLLHKIEPADTILAPNTDNKPGVWLAQDQNSGDQVIIRILPQSDGTDSASGQPEESFFMHGLVHPNIIRTLAVHQHFDGTGFLVTAYIRGAEPIEKHLQNRAGALGLLMPVLDALAYAHSLGLAHGNLSAEMILVTDDASPHLLSFGFCEHTPGWNANSFHLSPQVRSGAHPHPVDDIYSLGAILFRIFTAKTWQGQAEIAATNFPIPEAIESLISSMLSDSSYDRPDSIQTIRSKLEHYLNPDSEKNPGRIEETQFHKSGPAVTTPSEPINANAVHAPVREDRTISTTVALSIFLVLILLIGGVFFYLPSKVSTVAVTSSNTNTTIAAVATGNILYEPEEFTGLAPFEQAQRQRYQEEAKSSAVKLLRKQISLEDSGALLWAVDKMQRVQNLADEGDLLFRDADYEKSISRYQQGLSILDELKVSISIVQSDHLSRGHQALNSGNADTAVDAFTIVLAITPDQTDAAKGLARAQRLDEVLTLLKSADLLEDADQLEEALTIYEQARSIDPLWSSANDGVMRVTAEITLTKFNKAMSKGFSELKQTQFVSARESFSQAQALMPDSQQPADGLLQVDLNDRLQKIEQHKQQADHFAQQENWSAAITEFEAAMALDSNLIFALKGLEDAGRRLQLSNSLDNYINNPLSLNDSGELDLARQALYQGSLVSSPGKILSKQITAISQHIKSARILVEIVLKSDKLTDIIVYKVGQLGKLESRRLELYPGVYTVVGKRKGYRDVRKEFTLLAGQSYDPVFIRCSEKI